jgi:hypothetical protein
MYKYVTTCTSKSCSEHRYLWVDLETNDYYITGSSPEIIIYGQVDTKKNETGYIKSLDSRIKNATTDILIWPYKLNSDDFTNKIVQYQRTYWNFEMSENDLFSIMQFRQNYCTHTFLYTENNTEMCSKCYKTK